MKDYCTRHKQHKISGHWQQKLQTKHSICAASVCAKAALLLKKLATKMSNQVYSGKTGIHLDCNALQSNGVECGTAPSVPLKSFWHWGQNVLRGNLCVPNTKQNPVHC